MHPYRTRNAAESEHHPR